MPQKTLKELLGEAPETDTQSLPLDVATDSFSGVSAPSGADLSGRIAQNQKMLDLMDSANAQKNVPSGPMGIPLPNGGMEGATLDNYLKTHGGPVANIGYNPNAADNPKPEAPEAEESDEEESPSSDRGPASLLKKLQSLKANPTKNHRPIGDTLSELLGKNSDDLTAARDQRNQLQLLALLGHAGAQIGSAVTPLAKTMPDNTAFNALMTAAQQPITDIKSKQDLANETMKGQVLKGQASTEIQKTDPESAVSQAARDLYRKTTGKDADPSLSAADIEKMDPVLARIFTAEENAKNRAATRDAARGTKDADKKDKVDQHVGDMLESSRQTPDVRQAYLDAYSASKATTLLNKNFDLNKLSMPEVQLLTSEVAKIAQGGVPHKEELAALKPNGVPQWLSAAASKVTGAPTPANAGAFLKVYKEYLEDLTKNAKGIINDKVGRVIDTHEGRMNSQTAKLYREKYLKPLEEAKAEKKASSHPQDDEAIKWAKANPTDPMSAQILKANGVE